MRKKTLLVALLAASAAVADVPPAAAAEGQGAAPGAAREQLHPADDVDGNEAKRMRSQVRRRLREERHGRPYGLGYEARRETREMERIDRPERVERAERSERVERGGR